jgi:hypothetical protein
MVARPASQRPGDFLQRCLPANKSLIMACDCEFESDPEEPHEPAWHYRRTCSYCQHTWQGLHCPHDGHQRPCPQCGLTPRPEFDMDSVSLTRPV